MSREQFMEFFRNDEKIKLLTTDDRIEIFSQILPGSSDITKDLLDDLISDYGVENLVIIEFKDQEA